MRVFVTGASGHIGSALIPELLSAGHHVVGLARSDESAAAVRAAGAEVVLGSLDDLESLRDGALSADGVIHLAFKHTFTDFAGAAATDLRAVDVMGSALAGTGKPFVITSGTMLLAVAAAGRVGTESDVDRSDPPLPRVISENTAIALADRGVRSSVVRLAPSVHSSLDHHGFVPRLIGIARDKGYAAYVGEGTNRWPAVHTLDAATLYRLALEEAPAGTRVHGVADEGIPYREIAGAIGRQLTVPVTSLAPQDAESYFGFLARFVQADNPTSSARTQELLGWQPVRPGLLDDLAEAHYFAR